MWIYIILVAIVVLLSIYLVYRIKYKIPQVILDEIIDIQQYINQLSRGNLFKKTEFENNLKRISMFNYKNSKYFYFLIDIKEHQFDELLNIPGIVKGNSYNLFIAIEIRRFLYVYSWRRLITIHNKLVVGISEV